MSEGALPRIRGGKPLLLGFLAFLFLLLLSRWGVALYIDVLWFAAQDAVAVFWTRTLWEWGVRLLVGGVAGVASWFALRPVAERFSGMQIQRRFGDLVISEKVPRKMIRWALLGGAAVVGLWFAAAVPAGTGLRALLLWHGEPTGVVDPIFARDLAFYLFTLPVLQGAVTFALVLAVFVTALVVTGYASSGGIGWGRGGLSVVPAARRHLAILFAVFLLFLAIRFYLAPFGLLVDGNSGVQGIFGYADDTARIPAYRFLGFLALVTAGVVLWAGFQNRLIAAGSAAIVLGLAAIGVGEVYPAFVQRIQVEPNEIARETPYIEHAIEFTREGFGLSDLTRERLDYTPPSEADWSAARERLARLPIWTDRTLLTTFNQIEARFQYYEFSEVAFDRYPAGDEVEPVAVSVRQVNPSMIPDPNWQNLHLRERYLSGMGAVAGQLNRGTEEGRLPMFLTAIPPEYREGPGVPDELDLRRPSVYVGSRPQLHAVINPGPDAFLDPDGNPGTPGRDFPQGIAMGSIFRTAAFAWRFQDANLLFASEVQRESRFVFRRDVQSRVQELAPFLYLPEAPYAVVADGRIVWIMEGFTLSSGYPLATAHEITGRRRVNYLRNSAKISVDAVTGEVNIYVADPDEPILAAFRRAFPSLFREMDTMPAELRRHLRYSRYLLNLQSRVLVQYHQNAPPVFHGQQDRWTLATELSEGSGVVEYRPEYSLLTLPGEEEESFVLTTVFVPQGRQNLASFLAARWSPETRGELLLWDLPLEDQFPGPRQIEALVEQDPEISQQFSLWRQGGSQVWTGHLHLIPVGRSLFYIEPVFLAADADAIPEVRRFVVSDGRRVVMDPTLQGAISALAAGMEGVTAAAPDELPGDFDAAALEAAATDLRSREALELLEAAEASLREGDWEGFGRRWNELRALLQRLAGGG